MAHLRFVLFLVALVALAICGALVGDYDDISGDDQKALAAARGVRREPVKRGIGQRPDGRASVGCSSGTAVYVASSTSTAAITVPTMMAVCSP